MIKGFHIRVTEEWFVVDKEEDDADFLAWKRCESMEDALEAIRVEWEHLEG